MARHRLLVLASALAFGGCDSSAPNGPGPLAGDTATIIVSNPVQFVPAALDGRLHGNVAASGGSSEFVTYVSAAPGSVPGASSAEVVNLRSNARVPSTVMDGGFDPVAMPALEGDTLELSFTLPANRRFSARAVVPASRRPRVVRTVPAPGRRDVAINAVIGVVFSEPVDPTTLTDSTVRLLEGTVAVGGALRIPTEPVMLVEFVPDAPLRPGAEYRLLLDERIRDRSGDPLEAPGGVEFATTAAAGTGGLAVSVRISGDDPDIGFGLRVDGVQRDPLSPGDVVQVAGLPSGRHSIRLDDVDPNCVVAGGVDREVVIAPGQTLDVRFDVTCMALPPLTVTVRTTGIDAGPAGYTLLANGGSRGMVPANGTVALPGLRPEVYYVALEGVPGNCAAPPRLILVMAGVATGLEFDIACTADFTPPGMIAFAGLDHGGPSAIYTANADGSSRRRVTFGVERDFDPAWSPDGSRIAFVRALPVTGAVEIRVVNADGTGDVRIGLGGTMNAQPAWSPDGERVAFVGNPSGVPGLFVVRMDGGGTEALPIPAGADWVLRPAWSPDGGELAFIASWQGVPRIYVVNADGSDLRPLEVDASGVRGLAWLADGRISVTRTLSNAYVLGLDRAQVDVVASDGSVTSTPIDLPPTRVSWAADGQAFAYDADAWYGCSSCMGIRFMRPGGQRSSVLITNAFDPAWRP